MSSSRRKRRRSHALARYQKERQRNLLAQPGPLPVVLVLDHLKAGFNVPKIFRSAQAFGAREVHLIGIGPFDPAPAKGAMRSVPARFFEDFAESHRQLSEAGYGLYTLEPAGGMPLHLAELPERCAFVLGHEELGLSFDPSEYPGMGRLTIPLTGPMQSLNVSVAAAIVLYELSRRQQGINTQRSC
jgi:tRNA G18 (ribose-2'-O)-methylase SpoU